MKVKKINDIDLLEESHLYRIVFNIEVRRDDLKSDKLL